MGTKSKQPGSRVGGSRLAAPDLIAYTYPMDITQISDGEDWLIQRLTSILQDDAIQDLYVHQVIGALEMMKIQYAMWQLEDVE